MKNIQKTLFRSILAGICIAIGGTAFLMIENKIVGALFFTIGLFVICTHGFNLYTGKVCYVFENDKTYAFSILIIWAGNLIGTALVALLELLTRYGEVLQTKAQVLCDLKCNDNLLSIFILAIFCNICIYIAVDGFKNNPHEVGKYIALFLGVAVFILCGFEHCVANMYYFAIGGAYSLHAFGYLIVMTLGNAVGGVFIPLIKKYIINK